jgi:hypothetical protein
MSNTPYIDQLAGEGTTAPIHHPVPGDYQEHRRTYHLPSLAEPPSVVNVREIEGWCRRCMNYSPAWFSDENSAGLCFGAAIGLAGAWWAGDFTNHPDRVKAFKLLIVAVVILGVLFTARAISTRRKTKSDLKLLATDMALACKNGMGRVNEGGATDIVDTPKPPPQV